MNFDYNPIFENDYFSNPEEISPEDFDSINDFLNNVNHLDIAEERKNSRFSNRGE